jgi:hypothetical protein
MFADIQDVVDRFEGTIPDERLGWVEKKLADAETILTGLVPSLTYPDVSAQRLAQAKILVCDKVLELYRNPDGSTYRTQTYGSMTDARSFSKEVASGRMVFTEAELQSVRPPRTRRRFGSIPVSPWGVPL